MKKLFIMTVLSTSVSMACAQTDIYGGIGAGLNQLMSKRNVDDTIILDPPLSFPTTTRKSQDGATGGDFSAFIGIKQRIAQVALAAELTGNLSSAQTEAKVYNYANNNVTAIARIREQGNASLSVLPGLYINNKTEAFLRVGFQRGRFEAKSAGDTGGDLIATGQTTRWLSGYVLGAGMETSLLPYMNIRVDYAYSAYQSIKQASILPTSINLNADQIQSKVTPYDHLVMLSVVFHGPIEKVFSFSS